MNMYQKFVAYLQLREAVNKADRAHEKDGERYYVMPTKNGKLVVLDRANFRTLKRKHYISYKATQRDMLNECFYFTPYRNGDGYITRDGLKKKTAQFYSWSDAMRKLKKGKASV